MRALHRYCALLTWVVSALGTTLAHAHGGDAASHSGERSERDVKRRCKADPRVRLGQIPLEVCVGGELFFHETFQGNGRKCSTCHPADNNYTLDPEYISKLPSDDPLFVAENDPRLADLEISELLRGAALFVVNPDGLENPSEKFVVRSVSHMLGIATSSKAPPLDVGDATHATDGTLLPPLERLGWSGDGAPGMGELRDFADGAIAQHLTRSMQRRSGVDFVLPSEEQKDAIAAFSRAIGRTEDIDLSQVRLRDAAAERGRNTFLTGAARECALRCHINAGASAFTVNANDELQDPTNVSLDIGTALVRHPLVDALGIPLDGGFGTGPLDLDGDGVDDSFGNGGMNVPPLIEAADTAPMFHSNASATLEDAIRFYAGAGFADSFLANVSDFENRDFGEPMPITEQDIDELGRFLRVLNASLNVQMANYRLRSAFEVANAYGDWERNVVNGLVRLAVSELEDANQVLAAVPGLHTRDQKALWFAISMLQNLQKAGHHSRSRSMRQALSWLDLVERRFGTGLEMKLGPGTLMF